MRHFLAAVLPLLVFCSISSAQDKEFKAAIKKGANSDGYYAVDLSKKTYELADIEAYAKANKLTCRNITTGQVTAFGTVLNVVMYLEFKSAGGSGETTMTYASQSDRSSVLAAVSPEAKRLEREFSSASRGKPNDDGSYHLNLKSAALYGEDMVRAFAAQNGYSIMDLRNRRADNIAEDIYFAIDFTTYDLEENMVLFGNLKPTGNKVVGSGYACVDGNFRVENNIIWSGTIEGGKIHGRGKGLVRTEGYTHVFEGTYDHGRPIGTIAFHTNRYSALKGSGLYSGTYDVRKLSEGMTFARKVETYTPKENPMKSYHDRTRIGLYDEDYNLVTELMIRYGYKGLNTYIDFEVVSDFSGGYGIFRNPNLETEYAIDKQGNISYSPGEVARIQEKVRQIALSLDELVQNYKSGYYQVPYRASSALSDLREDKRWSMLSNEDAIKSSPLYSEYLLVNKATQLSDYIYSSVNHDGVMKQVRDIVSENQLLGRTTTFNGLVPNGREWMRERMYDAHNLAIELFKDPAFPIDKSNESLLSLLHTLEESMVEQCDDYDALCNDIDRYLAENTGQSYGVASTTRTKESTSDNDRQYSCTVHLSWSNGDEPYEFKIRYYAKSVLLSTEYVVRTDSHGNAVLTWDPEDGDTIEYIIVPDKVFGGESYLTHTTIDNLKLENGGHYNLLIPE